jgi:purine-binding chemotaxis protein CheW
MSAEAAQEILERRARHLARPLEQAPDAAALDLLVVQVAPEGRFGLDVGAVLHIVHNEQLARLPGASRALVGVTVIQGEAIPVADLAHLVGLGAPRRQRPFVVVVGGAAGPVGLLVDQVVDVVAVPEHELRLLPGAPEGRGSLQRRVTPDGVVLLDTSALLADERLTVPPMTSLTSGPFIPRQSGAP